MELALRLLKPQQQLRTDQGKEEFFKWEQLNTFEKQWRPFVVGVLINNEDGKR